MRRKISIIIQARLTSSRFPNKIINKVLGKPIILLLINRLKLCKEIHDLIVAIPKNQKNKSLEKLLKTNNVKVFKGPENNTLKRYYEAAKKNNSKIIIRITSDCPLADPSMIDHHVRVFNKYKPDYLSNNLIRSFPHGYDLEIFSFNSLKKAFKNSKTKYEKEHVTPYIRKSASFKKINLQFKKNFYFLRVTLDYKEDLKVIRNIFNYFKNKMFYLNDLINLYKKNSKSFLPNNKIKIYENLKNDQSREKWIDYKFRNIIYKN